MTAYDSSNVNGQQQGARVLGAVPLNDDAVRAGTFRTKAFSDVCAASFFIVNSHKN